MTKTSKTPMLDALAELKTRVEEESYRYEWLTLDWVNSNRPVSASSLKQFIKSPQHYIDYILADKKQTTALTKGSLTDVFLLTPNEADRSFEIMPDFGDCRIKVNREAKAEFIENNEKSGKMLVTLEEYETAMKMVESVYRDKDAMYYLSRVKKTQVELDWVDKASGLRNKGFVDGESIDNSDEEDFILDLKTTRDGSTNKFIRQAHDLGYHIQSGGYTNAYKRKWYKFPAFIFITVDNVAPYSVNVFRADDQKYLKASQEEYLNVLLAFKYCLDHREFDKGYAFHRFMTKYNRMELPFYHKPAFG